MNDKDILGLQDRVALVTGAAQGLGLGIATRLANAGARVVIADRNADGAIAAAQGLADQGLEGLGVGVDVTDEKLIERCFVETTERFGGLDILVNNAGIHCEKIGEQSTIAQFALCLDVNLVSIWRVSQAALPLLRQSSRPRIVNIASMNAKRPWSDTPAYSASKAGVVNLTQSMAMLYSPDGVNVNSICPGSIATAMADMFFPDVEKWQQVRIGAQLIKKPVTPSNIGDAVVYFASSLADLVTGQSLNVDGGIVLS